MRNASELEEEEDGRWEPEGDLGHSVEHAKRAPREVEERIAAGLGLHAISLRLQTTLIEQLKTIARGKGIGYQTLIRMALTEYVKNEMRPGAVALPSRNDLNP